MRNDDLKILLVDDEPDVLESLSMFLNSLEYKVTCANDGIDALQKYHTIDFDVIITDIRMPRASGLDLLKNIKIIEKSPIDIIVFTGHGDMDSAIQALKYGAYDYLKKPININELSIILDRSKEKKALQKKFNFPKDKFNKNLESNIGVKSNNAQKLLSKYLREIGLDNFFIFSNEMHEIINVAEKYASDRTLPILIDGESGTGKELIARYIHFFGENDPKSPFIAINCGAITQDLFEGELFGHDAGAYTGSTSTGKIGKLEAANGGTIFLDEIGEMPLNAQVKLLRAIEYKRIFRLGAVKEIPIDIRVISATNKNLINEVREKRFRLDLYYRINTARIHIPPLRERSEEIIPLALSFLKRESQCNPNKHLSFTPSAENLLTSYDWPGNVRQLRNVIHSLSLSVVNKFIDYHDINELIQVDIVLESSKTFSEIPILAKDKFLLPEVKLDLNNHIKQIILMAIDKNAGNKSATARYLGITRRILNRYLRNIQSITREY